MTYPSPVIEKLNREYKLSESDNQALMILLNIDGIQFLIENNLINPKNLFKQLVNSIYFLSTDQAKLLNEIYQAIKYTNDFKEKKITVSNFILNFNYHDKNHFYVINPNGIKKLISENETTSLAQELENLTIIISKKSEALDKWIEIKKDFNEIRNIPNSKIKEKRNRSIELLSKSSSLMFFLTENRFLAGDFTDITELLLSYMNANLEIIKEIARKYFSDLLYKENKTIIDINFYPKKGGDQLGTKIVLRYKTSEETPEHTISYYVKTHQHDSNSRSSEPNPVDPKELFIYKLLEYIGVGSKVHFMLNSLSSGGFFIATQDVESTKVENKSKFFRTFNKLDQTLIPNNTDNIKNLLTFDLLVRVLRLHDVLTNSGNFGQVIINDSRIKWKIIDFRVAESTDTYTYQDIFEGFKKGNGSYNYSAILEKIINNGSEKEKIELASQILSELNTKQPITSKSHKTTLQKAIEKAYQEVKNYVQENSVALGIKNIKGTLDDFLRYKTDISKNYASITEGIQNYLKFRRDEEKHLTMK